jgi:hypothetical protein
MRGGITSGVVYPMAVATLAERYRFRSIGGTSAGAIAAAVTAAASYGRRNGYDGFADVRKLPNDLGRITPNGRTTLMSLFKAEPATAPLLRIALAAIGRSGYVAKIFTLWSAFPLGSALGGLFGILPTVLLVSMLSWPTTAWGWSTVAVAVIVGLLIALLGSLIGGGLSAILLARRALPQNRYGLCSGKGEADRSGVPALTDWLHNLIQRVAGRGDDPEAPPVTFGDLWGTGGDETAERDIELVLMTSNITQAVSHRLPFIDGPSGAFFFKEEEFESLFPKRIVRWLKDHARPLEPSSEIDCPRGYYCLPVTLRRRPPLRAW